MSSSRRRCKYDPDAFCYICGEYMMKEQKRNINYFVKRAYKAYFDMKLGHQNKPWAPHLACKTCVGSLRGWTKGKLKLNFAVPMVWREPKYHLMTATSALMI